MNIMTGRATIPLARRLAGATHCLEGPSLVTERPPDSRTTDKDQIKPFHAKEVSTGQEAADVVAAVIKHAAAREEAAKKKAPPKPQPIWMLPLGLTLAVLATFLLVAPPPWVVVNPIAAQSPDDVYEKLKNAIYIQAQRIEGYRMLNGRYPPSLAEAGVSVEGLDYMPNGDNYTLISTAGDRDVVFNSAVESLRDWAAREVRGLTFGS